MARFNFVYLAKLYLRCPYNGDGDFGSIDDMAKSIGMSKYVISLIRNLIKAHPECFESKVSRNGGMPVKVYRLKRQNLLEIIRLYPELHYSIKLTEDESTPPLKLGVLDEHTNEFWLGNGHED